MIGGLKSRNGGFNRDGNPTATEAGKIKYVSTLKFKSGESMVQNKRLRYILFCHVKKLADED